ncbi:unnamed protein product [Ixodes hexagonus]
MQHVMQLLHNSVTPATGKRDEVEKKDWECGDKLAILFGDFFLALALKQILDVQDPTVLSTFAKGIESYATCNFEDNPQQCSSLPVSAEWWEDCTQQQCSWLPTAFECSLLVAGVQCPDELAAARKCGTSLALAIQVCLQKYHLPSSNCHRINRGSLKSGLNNLANVYLRPYVNEQVMNKMRGLVNKYDEEIFDYIDGCATSSEGNALQNIVHCLRGQ